MAWLGPPLRWPDVLSPSTSLGSLAEGIRPHLPDSLQGLPPSVIVSVSLSLVLVSSLTLWSAILNQRRQTLVAPHPQTTVKRRSGQNITALLIGPEQTGKSAIFSALVLGAVPETQTSQHENESRISLSSTSLTTEKPLAPVSVHLVDVPGHSRLRMKVDEFLPIADKIVFCVDAASAVRGTTSKNESLTEAVDLFHATLTALARNRLSRSAAKRPVPPSLLVLFTRGDLSPLLSVAPNDSKRQAQVVSRARAAFEAELGRRRAGMGLGRGAAGQPRAKVGGMSKVVGGGSTNAGWFGAIKNLLGLGGSSSGASPGDGGDDEDEEDSEGIDYVDWAWQQRAATSSGAAGASAALSLDKLDEEVVHGGKATFAVGSLGKERGWAPASVDEKEGSSVSSFEGLKGMQEWLVDPDV